MPGVWNPNWPPASAGGGGGAPTTAQYLVLATDGTLTMERVLTLGPGLTEQDNGAGSSLIISAQQIQLMSDQLDVPNNAAWAVNAAAPTISDSNDNDIKVSAFDDTTEEGRGFDLFLPAAATHLKFTWLSRGDGSSGDVLPKLYYKNYPDGSAPDASFTASTTAFSVLAMPATANFVLDSEELSFADIGLTANNFYNFEFTRDATAGGDDYVGDWFLKMMQIEVIRR